MSIRLPSEHPLAKCASAQNQTSGFGSGFRYAPLPVPRPSKRFRERSSGQGALHRISFRPLLGGCHPRGIDRLGGGCSGCSGSSGCRGRRGGRRCIGSNGRGLYLGRCQSRRRLGVRLCRGHRLRCLGRRYRLRLRTSGGRQDGCQPHRHQARRSHRRVILPKSTDRKRQINHEFRAASHEPSSLLQIKAASSRPAARCGSELPRSVER